MENTLLNAANGLAYEEPLIILEKSNYNNDFDYKKLRSHLTLLPDTIKLADPSIKKVTNIRTIFNAMNTQRDNVIRSTQTSENVFDDPHNYSHM